MLHRVQHGLGEKERNPFFGGHFSNSGATLQGSEGRGRLLSKGEDNERQWEELIGLNSGLSKGAIT